LAYTYIVPVFLAHPVGLQISIRFLRQYTMNQTKKAQYPSKAVIQIRSDILISLTVIEISLLCNMHSLHCTVMY